MFACGAYPGYPEFIENVSKEVECTLKRLRNHCCLTIYAGNNEDYQVAEQMNLDWDPDDHNGDYSKTNFPARTIYERTLPQLVSKYHPEVPYHPGSPWGGKCTADPTVGDIHQWNVWHGSQEKYQDWYKLGGRFISEFGMEALPVMKTYLDCITDESELYPQSSTVDFHNKAEGFERRLALYVIENIKITKMDLEGWIYATQLMQSECLSYAYKCWRRNWRGDGKRYTGGAIVWQLNDCCPIASWAIVDHYYRPKLAYYAVKRESAPLNLGLYRNVIELPYGEKQYSVDIWGVNSSLHDQSASLVIGFYDITSGNLIKQLEGKDVVLKANQTTEFYEKLELPNSNSDIVVFSKLEFDGKTIVTGADWPQPLKYLKFPDREVDAKVENDQIVLTANKPVKGVDVTVTNRDVYLEDNGFDIFPMNPVVLKAPGLEISDKISVNYYQK
ncbi:unnamed protein product [Ambrosiozyma monospora]|uniref:Unnamed protein product n=1 Tax=Ambrosiozyma monospora TaxID=43982 RepID=A0ACB5T8H2_AMBMO|nr:unnamed protein product [Ambrosiozyma monospora]